MATELERAIELFQSRDFQAAVDALQPLVAADAGNWLAQAWLARTLMRFGSEEAEIHTELALAIAPGEGFAHFARAEVLADAGHSDEAIEEVQQAIALDAAQPDYYALLAELHYWQTRREESLVAAEKGLAIDPQHAGCLDLKTQTVNYLEDRLGHRSTDEGNELLRSGHPREAAAKFCQALIKNPHRGYVQQCLFSVLHKERSVLGLLLRGLQFVDDWRRIAMIPFWVCVTLYLAYLYFAPEDAIQYWLFMQGVIAYGVAVTLIYDLINIVLWLSPRGRLTLRDDALQGAKWMSLCAAAAILGLVTGNVASSGDYSGLGFVFSLLIFPVHTIYRCRPGWRRKLMVAMTLILLMLGLFGRFPLSLLPESWQTEDLSSAMLLAICLYVTLVLLHILILERILTREES